MGSIRITTSITMLGTELPMKNLRVSIHLEGMVRSQYPWTGLHENMDTRIQATPQAITNAPTMLVAIANLGPGKIARKKRRIEILVAESVMLYSILDARVI